MLKLSDLISAHTPHQLSQNTKSLVTYNNPLHKSKIQITEVQNRTETQSQITELDLQSQGQVQEIRSSRQFRHQELSQIK